MGDESLFPRFAEAEDGSDIVFDDDFAFLEAGGDSDAK